MLKRLVAVVIIASPTIVSAQMTVCQGDVCTEEVNGVVTRTLSPDEVAKMKRANARTAIGNIECKAAGDPKKCEELLQDLFAQFPL